MQDLNDKPNNFYDYSHNCFQLKFKIEFCNDAFHLFIVIILIIQWKLMIWR